MLLQSAQDDISVIFERLGDICREEHGRTFIAVTHPEVMLRTVQYLQDENNVDMGVKALGARFIGNLSVDNDETRIALLSVGTIPVLTELLKANLSHPLIVRNVTGAFGNLCCNNGKNVDVSMI